MAVDPEFVRLIKRWIRPTSNKEEQKQQQPQASSSSVKPIQLDDEEDDLR
jgi:hypothetical protein